MLTYLGDLGGLMSVLVPIGAIISSPIVSRLFQADLVKKTYRIQHYLKDMEPYYESKKQDGNLSTESGSADSG